jgi:lipid-A-disaccharide synthase
MNLNTHKSIFIFAGEPSGDVIGASLIASLKQRDPDTVLTAVAGPEMRAQEIDLFLRSEQFAVMGIFDVLKALPRIVRLFLKVRNRILESNPDGVVLIDYPGFNLRLAKSLRKRGYKEKIIHYVAPTVWAHGAGRIKTLVNTLDLLLLIFPFEKEIFQKTPLEARYVGDPLWDKISNYDYKSDPRKNLIALFPGSRTGEIQRNLPLILAAVELLKRDIPDATFALSVANDEVKPLLEKTGLEMIPTEGTYDLMACARTAIAVSGTVNRELAIHQIPTTVVYLPGRITGFIAKTIMGLNLPYYSIANIIAGRELFPEFIDYKVDPREVAQAVKPLYLEGEARDRCLEGCKSFLRPSDSPSPGDNAAKFILEQLHPKDTKR